MAGDSIRTCFWTVCEGFAAAFDALRAAVSRVCQLTFDALTTPERLGYLEKLEQEARRLPVPGHALINQIAEQADEETLGGRLPAVLATRLRITRAEARRPVADAADLGPRHELTGELLPPLLTATRHLALVRLLHRTGRLEVLGAHDLSPRLGQDGTQQHDALCAGAGVVTRHRRSSHRPQVYLTVVQDAGARRGRGPVQ